jgi:LysM repeat protein
LRISNGAKRKKESMQKVLSVFRAMLHRKWTMGVATLVIFGAVVAGGFVLQPSLSVGAASNCSSVYTVRWGDTLGYIALRYHSSVHAIAQASHIWNPDLIFPGQRLCIPASHKVSSGGGTVYHGPPHGSSVASMIYSVFGSYASGAMRVANCESGLNPRAYNPVSVGGSHAMGVFQILYPSTWMGTPQAANSPYDPMANILAAHNIFVRDGYSWREWVCQPG